MRVVSRAAEQPRLNGSPDVLRRPTHPQQRADRRQLAQDGMEARRRTHLPRGRGEEESSRSFRVEIKEHGNPDIRNLSYLGLRCTNLRYSSGLLSFLNNANVEFMTEFASDDLQVMHQQFIIGRNFPLPRCRAALALYVGVIYENSRNYTGRLADSDADELTFVFRPNIKFLVARVE